jgi:hypothetical protein
MTDPFSIDTNGVEVSVTCKAGPGYEVPWVVFKGDITEVAKKFGFAEDRDAKASDLLKLAAPVARYFQREWEGDSRPKGR